jgi:DUF971 family protein
MTGDILTPKVWPTKINLNKKNHTLDILFDDGSSFTFTAEYLRVESPSGDICGHGSSQTQIIPGRRNVKIVEVEPVGNFAIRIYFNDNHNAGIYSWSYLHDLGTNMEENWRRYLELLKSFGLSR